jgi:hypothetical protein
MEIVSTQPAAIKEATIRLDETDIVAMKELFKYLRVDGSHAFAMRVHDFVTKVNSLPTTGSHGLPLRTSTLIYPVGMMEGLRVEFS